MRGVLRALELLESCARRSRPRCAVSRTRRSSSIAEHADASPEGVGGSTSRGRRRLAVARCAGAERARRAGVRARGRTRPQRKVRRVRRRRRTRSSGRRRRSLRQASHGSSSGWEVDRPPHSRAEVAEAACCRRRPGAGTRHVASARQQRPLIDCADAKDPRRSASRRRTSSSRAPTALPALRASRRASRAAVLSRRQHHGLHETVLLLPRPGGRFRGARARRSSGSPPDLASTRRSSPSTASTCRCSRTRTAGRQGLQRLTSRRHQARGDRDRRAGHRAPPPRPHAGPRLPVGRRAQSGAGALPAGAPAQPPVARRDAVRARPARLVLAARAA